MRRRILATRTTLLAAAATAFSLMAALSAARTASQPAAAPADTALAFVPCDPDLVVGSDSCIKCHDAEFQQWKQTPHFAAFDSLHRKPDAKAIAKRLGLRSVKRNETCVKCHYTQQNVDGRHRIVAGVSCESCHGAARDWIDLHSDYGGSTATKQFESAAHRLERIEGSIAAGMNNPANLYLVARQCLACHTSPNEDLVNVGHHNPGSAEFELVAWSQGMVRHNFLRTGGEANAPSDPERRRVMYVVGVMADLEASIRATAAATEKALFGVTAAKRAARLKRRMYQIYELTDNQHVRRALEAALTARLKLNNREVLLAAADEISRAAYDLAESDDGSTLSAIDELLPGQQQYR